MTETGSGGSRDRRYRFSRPPHYQEIEVGAFSGDDAAEAHARELSSAGEVPVVIERQGLVDWEYVTEVDERS